MKKVISLVLAAMLFVSAFAGCNSAPASSAGGGSSAADQPSSSEAGGGSGGERTLTIAGHARMYPGEEEAWDAAIEGFMKENPDIKATVNWQGQWDQIPENVSAAKLAGEKIDLYSCGAGVIRQSLIQAKLVMDVTDLVEPYRDRFAEGMLDGITIGDKVWAFPIGSSGSCTFYYNESIFEELGLKEPTTYEELVALCNTIKEKKGIEPILQQGKVATYWPMWFMETYAQSSGNKSVDNVRSFVAGDKKFNGAEEIKAFEMLKQFTDDGLVGPDSFNTDGDGMRAAFAQGKAAMFFGGTWEYTSALAAVGDAFKIGVFEFPVMLSGVKSQHGGGCGTSLMIPTFGDPDNIDVTMKFMEYVTRPENAGPIIEPASPIIPSIVGVEPGDDPFIQKINEVHKKNTIPFLDWIWPAEINDAFTQAIPAVMGGYMTPEEAANKVQDTFDTMVKEKEYKYDFWSDWTDADWEAVTPKFIPESYAK